MPAPVASRWAFNSPPPATISRSSTAATASAALGATTPTRAPPATCRHTSTRIRSRSIRGGARHSPTSLRSSATWRRSPLSGASRNISSAVPASPTLRWRDDAQCWTVETADGATHEFDAVVTAVGMLDVPNIPEIPGSERFRGRTFHSSNWDHSKSTAGERVASIGTGASAIQYVPEIAAEAAHLTVFQRTPIWVNPRVRRTVHPRAAGTLRTRPGRGAQGARCGVPGIRGRQLRRRFRNDQGPDGHGPRVSGSKGAPTLTCAPSSRPPIQSAASGLCSRAPGSRRSRGRT